ncbi:MAG: AAA family ATPase [Pseudomonadota bacterium]
MKRTLITGAPGSGTSTLGRALAERLGCKFFDADDYYWLPTDPPFVEKATSENRTKTFLADTDVQNCVIAGSVVNWGREIEDGFDLVVFRLLDTNIRLKRLLVRENKRFGKADPIFMEWAANYDEGRLPGRSRLIHEAWLSQRTCTILRIEGDIRLDDQIEMVIGATINASLDTAASRSFV